MRPDEPGANDNGVVDVEEVPDAGDGLTKKERVVLRVLAEAQKERAGRRVPMVMLYGRVVEKVDMSPQELIDIVRRFTGEDPRKT
jgi:hypothetical protein